MQYSWQDGKRSIYSTVLLSCLQELNYKQCAEALVCLSNDFIPHHETEETIWVLSRVAFITLSVIGKIFWKCKTLRNAIFIRLTKNYGVVLGGKPSSFLISCHFATQRHLHSTSNPVRSCSCPCFDIAIQFVHMRTCYSNISCG